MNILLVLPRTFANLKEPTHFPVGIAYVSSSLKAKNHVVKILNLNFEQGDVYELLERTIEKNNIEIVETSGLITHYALVKEITDCVKKINPNVYTLIGGGIITGAPKVVMKGIESADFGVIGEGEITNCEVSNILEQGGKLEEIKGIVWRKKLKDKDANISEVVINEPREEIKDLDSIPWPDYEGFQLDKMLELAPKKYVTMSTGRACACHCTFCFHTSGQTYRQRSLDSFFEELDYLVNKYGIDNLYITDELFACNKKRLEELCSRIKKYNILWAVQLRVNIVDKPMLQMLKDAGCIIISFGLESADNRVLKSMKKGITVEMIESALKNSFEVGINAHGNFIFGDIREDNETVENTLKWWSDHREYNINLALIQVYPGTYIYQYAVEKGIITDELKFIEDGCPYVNISQLSDSEYKELGLKIERSKSEYLPKFNKNIKIIKHKEKYRINVAGICTKCGTKNEYQRISTASISTVKCRSCGKKYTLDPFTLYIDNVKANIKKQLSKDEKIAFWGANAILQVLYDDLDKLNEYDFIIVDTNNILYNTEFCNHTIKSIDAIKSENINTVIVCDFEFETYVFSRIKSEFKNVTKVISAGGLVETKMAGEHNLWIKDVNIDN